MSNTTPTLPQGPQSHSQYGPQGGGYLPQPMSPAEAKAHAKAAKAHAKAMRPWFKKKRFIVPIALIAIIGVVSVASGAGENSATQQPVTSAAAPADSSDKAEKAEKAEAAGAEAKIGTPVATGEFEITITKVREGGKQVGSEYVNEKADGHYQLVSVKVKNTGDDANYFFGDNIKLIDSKGREFSSDSAASLVSTDNNVLLAEEINPGNTAKGVLAFDMPKGVDAEQATITGSIFDGPVTVDLN